MSKTFNPLAPVPTPGTFLGEPRSPEVNMQQSFEQELAVLRAKVDGQDTLVSDLLSLAHKAQESSLETRRLVYALEMKVKGNSHQPDLDTDVEVITQFISEDAGAADRRNVASRPISSRPDTKGSMFGANGRSFLQDADREMPEGLGDLNLRLESAKGRKNKVAPEATLTKSDSKRKSNFRKSMRRFSSMFSVAQVATADDFEDEEPPAQGSGNSSKFFNWEEGLINPRSHVMAVWDAQTTVLLLITAVVTPYEVAFVGDSLRLDFMFFLNIFIDLCFFVDMWFQFLLPYPNAKGVLIKSHKLIANRYLNGWFSIDLISILPFNMLSYIVNNDQLSQLAILRAIRLLRLAKLLKMLRGSRLFKRWEARLFINYALMNLAFLIVSLVIGSHWLACAWGFIVSMDNEADSFVDWFPIWEAYLETALEKYSACMYFSVGLVTAMGDAESVQIRTKIGQTAYIVVMGLAGVANAYLIGGVVSLIERMNQSKSDFYRDMDILNEFLHTKRIPEGNVILQDGKEISGQDLCEKLRTFYIFKHTQGNLAERFQAILFTCSEQMQSAIAAKMHADELHTVPLFRTASRAFVTQLAKAIRTEILAAKETVYDSDHVPDKLYIVERGLVLCKGKMLRDHAVFGHDVLHSSHTKTRGHLALTLTETVLLSMDKETIERTVRECGDVMMRVRIKMIPTLTRVLEITMRSARICVNTKRIQNGFDILRQEFPEHLLSMPQSPIIMLFKARILKFLEMTGGRGLIDHSYRVTYAGVEAGDAATFDLAGMTAAVHAFFDFLEARALRPPSRRPTPPTPPTGHLPTLLAYPPDHPLIA